jgi:hypothetical protein
MRYFLLGGVIVFLLLSCSSENEIPKEILKPEAMQLVTWDMLQADELATQNKNADTSINLEKESFRLYEQVFAIHKISKDQYYKSYKYYQQHPSLYKRMMDGVRTIAEKEKKATTDPKIKKAELQFK